MDKNYKATIIMLMSIDWWPLNGNNIRGNRTDRKSYFNCSLVSSQCFYYLDVTSFLPKDLIEDFYFSQYEYDQ
jgi:hypothetical protein